jgi:hypothetical protein
MRSLFFIVTLPVRQTLSNVILYKIDFLKYTFYEVVNKFNYYQLRLRNFQGNYGDREAERFFLMRH